jgi:hypothetical protein
MSGVSVEHLFGTSLILENESGWLGERRVLSYLTKWSFQAFFPVNLMCTCSE